MYSILYNQWEIIALDMHNEILDKHFDRMNLFKDQAEKTPYLLLCNTETTIDNQNR